MILSFLWKYDFGGKDASEKKTENSPVKIKNYDERVYETSIARLSVV